MLKVLCVICLGLATFPALSQPVTKYEVATIIAVKPHTISGGRRRHATEAQVRAGVSQGTVRPTGGIVFSGRMALDLMINLRLAQAPLIDP